MTERLYYRDAYLRTFRANLIEIAGGLAAWEAAGLPVVAEAVPQT